MPSESLVKVKKKAKVLELRKGKGELLKREYENFQRCLHWDKSVPLYSATRQQAEGFLEGETQAQQRIPNDPQKRRL
jgi:hypothetical protein